MSSAAPSISDTPISVQVAMKFEDVLQAFAIRAACFVGDLGIPVAEEFDDHEYVATHLLALLAGEPIGAVRVRWFGSFAVLDKLAVLQRCRGSGVGSVLLEHCRSAAERRGCKMLYSHALPQELGYFLKRGWRKVSDFQTTAGGHSAVTVVRAVDGEDPLRATVPEAIMLNSRSAQQSHPEA